MRYLALLALLTGCAGTADVPQRLTPMAAPADPAVEAESPAYGAIDKHSFSGAVLLYPAAAGGEHQVPVGDYLIGKLAQSLGEAKLVRLRKLDARCVNGGGFGPKAYCSARLEVRVDDRTLTGNVSNLKVGPVYVVRDQLVITQTQYSDAWILKEARIVMDAVVADALAPAPR